MRIPERLLACALVFFAPFVAFADATPERQVIDRIAAFVGEEILTLHDVERAVQSQRAAGSITGTLGFDGETAEAQRRQALTALIDERLVLAEARRLQMEISPAEIDAQIARTMRQNRWTKEDLITNVGRLGFTLEDYRTILLREKLKARIVAIRVGSRVHIADDEIQQELDRNYGGGLEQAEVRASIIVRRVPMGANADAIAEVKRFAGWVRSQAAAAPDLFAELARKFSEHEPTRVHGGDLGFFTRGTFADEALDLAAFSTAVGEVSEVIETGLGLQIVHITDRRMTPVVDLDGMRESIFQKLYVERRAELYLEWLRELREKAYIDIRI